ncbi:TPA: ABC transporter ATP-binding protein [Candidatus Uhrbacteria bacterium]|uniref:ABC transporter-related protein n=1 Tax=Candidatus Uhrbacteria bacterium GW2011_GWC2_53_7 TaxID=1618986 RepID=A0A0G1Y0K7_9BACT|nr:MAG: ABC transporter-related protein [Parcubacteria group bacterium GW2011_GWA2_53_21]KKW36660.1 MAG: ABC transporter-related protein [Candidatus Uhrbacteria bacterium GW2011_GWC2_53_7]HBL39600.1 ABC transporter ATP-binding protein [Candidatus Uhrbacteria bacterium]
MKEQNDMKPLLVLRMFWRMTAGFRWPFFGIWVLIALTSAVWIVYPWIYKAIFDTLAGPPSAETLPYLLRLIGLMAVLYLFTWGLWRVTGFGSSWIYTRIESHLQVESFHALLRHSYRFFSNNFSGSLVRQTNRFVDAFGRLGEKFQWNLIPLVVTLVGVTIALSLRHALLGIIMAAWIVVVIGLNVWLSLWKLKYDIRRAAMDSKMTGMLSDAITNSSNIKLFSAYTHEHDRYGAVVEQHRRLQKWTWDLAEIIMSVQTLLMGAIEIGLMYAGIRLWQRGLLTVGDFALLQAYLISVFDKLWEFGRTIREIYEQLADASEMAVILDTPYEVMDARGAKKLKVERGRIEFQDVEFRYHKTRRVLSDFTLSIAAGEKVALVGSSGAGKSTVTKLLMRFFDVTSGNIFIDGQDIARVKMESLWENVALVPQEPMLFHRTIMENIRYGEREASDEEAVKAAKLAHAHEFIQELPQGYDTYVGERGVKLSGGERQRVAIARAILKNAPILVLDEATSSLDSESESLIQDALKKLMKGKTTIVIAHRLSTIMQMDRIVVVEKGRVVDMGTHEELLKKKGMYQKLWNIQAGGFI